MANLTSNPWNFTTADQATTAAITSIVRQGIASALLTSTTAHSIVANQYFSIQGTTPAAWNGIYRAEVVPTATTIAFDIPSPLWNIGNAGAVGNVLSVAYAQDVDVTQMLWDSPTANGVLLLTGGSGNIVWNPTAVTGGTLTYAKVFPIFGLVINSLPSGTLQVSV